MPHQSDALSLDPASAPGLTVSRPAFWIPFRNALVVAGYGLASVCVYPLAYLVVEGRLPVPGQELAGILGLLVVIRLCCSQIFVLSTSQWRFVGVADVLRLAGAVALGTAVAYLCSWIAPMLFPIPARVLFLEGILYGGLVAAAWIGYRALFERVRFYRARVAPSRRVVVIGAGEAGNLLVREMLRFPTGYRPVAFLDDDISKHGARIHGVRVYGRVADLPRVAVEVKAEEAIIAIPSASPEQLRELVATCERSGLKLKVLPGIVEVLAGDVRVNQLRDVRIEDLLGRDPILLELPELAADLRGRSVLITGAAGSIGSELARQVALHQPGTLVLFDQAETALFFVELELRDAHPDLHIVPVIGDIVDHAAVERVFEEYRPERVFHAAAYKHVPLMEVNAREAVLNNVIGTWRVADAAGRHGAEKFVLVSTDKAVRPANVMGATKCLAERIVLELQHRYRETTYGAVRFGNVLGSNGSVIPVFRKQLEEGKPLTVTHPETTRYFMTIPEAVQLILQASLLPELRGQIAMLDMGEPVKIRDLAVNLLRLAGVRGDLERHITYTGLRPGEKLHEELIAPDECARPTKVAKVRMLETPARSESIIFEVAEWERELAEGQDELVLEALLEEFPTLRIGGEKVSSRERVQHAAPAVAISRAV